MMFEKNNKDDKVWWVRDKFGELNISFDKKKIFNLFTDYPNGLSEKQKQLFDKENPFWADFFKGDK